MDAKATKQGMANQAWTEFENFKRMREEFIICNAEKCHIVRLERLMQEMYDMYMILTGNDSEEQS